MLPEFITRSAVLPLNCSGYICKTHLSDALHSEHTVQMKVRQTLPQWSSAHAALPDLVICLAVSYQLTEFSRLNLNDSVLIHPASTEERSSSSSTEVHNAP